MAVQLFFSPMYMFSFLEHIFHSGCEVQYLSLGYGVCPYFFCFNSAPGGRLWPVLQQVMELHYHAIFNHDSFNNHEVFSVILDNLPNLETLHWDQGGKCGPVPFALMYSPPSSLREVCLANKEIDSDGLEQLLMMQCNAPWTSLEFYHITLIRGEKDPWTEVFRQLREMPNLESLSTRNGAKRRERGHARLYLQFLIPEDMSFERWSYCETLASQPFLDWNLQHGLTYCDDDSDDETSEDEEEASQDGDEASQDDDEMSQDDDDASQEDED